MRGGLLNTNDQPVSYLSKTLQRLARVEPRETGAALAAFLYLFWIFTSYFMLRPVRETMGITGGIRNLQWLFSATFVAMLAAVPLFGIVTARFRRAVFVPWISAFFMLHMLVFAVFFQLNPDGVWTARVFYVWLSVFNFFVISVAWSLMVDVFSPEQSRRLFAFISAGASAGGLLGPVLGGLLVGGVGYAGLMILAAVLLSLTLFCIRYLLIWQARGGSAAMADSTHLSANLDKPMGGNPLAGFWLVARSPYMLGISAFVILLATATTFLYFDQARLVQEAFPLKTQQTQVFSAIDFAVQALAIITQLFFTARIAERLDVVALLALVPALMVVGFLALSAAPVFWVLAAVMILRRSGEYALVRPGREMLFTTVDVETKYKAKNFIDTVVYRGGDAVSGWAKAGLDMLGQGFSFVALIGAALAAVWAWVGYKLGRMHQAERVTNEEIDRARVTGSPVEALKPAQNLAGDGAA